MSCETVEDLPTLRDAAMTTPDIPTITFSVARALLPSLLAMAPERWHRVVGVDGRNWIIDGGGAIILKTSDDVAGLIEKVNSRAIGGIDEPEAELLLRIAIGLTDFTGPNTGRSAGFSWETIKSERGCCVLAHKRLSVATGLDEAVANWMIGKGREVYDEINRARGQTE